MDPRTTFSSSYSISTAAPSTTGGQNYTEPPAPDGTNECAIEPQLAFIVAASTGGLIIILLISLFVVSFKLITLKRKYQIWRSRHRKRDLPSGSGRWDDEQIEGGVIGPYETNLLLDEVQTEAEEDEANEVEHEAAVNDNTTPNMGEEKSVGAMPTSTSRDSSMDPVKELEDMALVV